MRERRRYAADEVAGFDKRVLAQLYYPENTAACAMKRLRQDIMRCAELGAELRRVGYSTHQHRYTPAQVALLYYYLGEP